MNESNKIETYFAIVFNYDSRRYEVAGIESDTPEQAVEEFIKTYPSLAPTARRSFNINHITTDQSLAVDWCRDENYYLECERLDDQRFEEMAYGPRDRMNDVYGDDRPGEGGASDYFLHCGDEPQKWQE